MLGHEWAVTLLSEHVAREQVRHAYLFTGPQGIGRRTLALRLAQALNCTQPVRPGEPCFQCRVCQHIDSMQQPDLAIVQAEQEGGVLRVEQVRDLQHSLALAPYEARYRVALLLRFEEAHPSAMNALLKTLEEPASQVILMLTADSAESLLPTIVSRCMVLRLRPLSIDQVARGLQELWGIPGDQARLLAHISGGRPGYAYSLFRYPERLERRRVWLDDHFQLLSASQVQRFAYAETLAKDKESLRMALLVWLSFWRDVLLRTAGASAEISNVDCSQEVDEIAARIDLSSAHRMVSTVERILDLLSRNINPRLAAEIVMLDLPHR
ncbi:MAG: DNA polymerase III subunit [Anaerolineales bacterium]|nr:DNA polymerase III subunit [Anaerolineales bacterium]